MRKLIGLLTLGVLLCGQAWCATPAEEIWWKLNDDAANTTITDSSGNNRHGTAARNTNLTTTAGKIDKGIQYNGSSDLITVGDQAFIAGNKLSIAVWLKGNSSDYHAIFQQWAQSAISFWQYNTNEFFTYIATSTGDSGSQYNYTTSGSHNDSTWVHVILVYDGTLANANRVQIYLNTSAMSDASSASIPTTIPNANSSPTSGRDTNNKYADFALEDMRIYDAALTSDERAALYNSGDGISTSLEDAISPPSSSRRIIVCTTN